MCIKVPRIADRDCHPESEKKSLSMSTLNIQKTSVPIPIQMVLQQKLPKMAEVAFTSGTITEWHASP